MNEANNHTEREKREIRDCNYDHRSGAGEGNGKTISGSIVGEEERKKAAKKLM